MKEVINMQISFYIVLDANISLRHIRVRDSNEYEYTNTGTIIYPFNTPLPIIRKGEGCIGIATVTKIIMTGSATTVRFTYTEVDEQMAKAYYSLYKNSAVMNASDDVYANAEDTIIPGAFLNKPTMKQPKRPSSGRSLYEEAGLVNPKRSGIRSIRDDYDD